MKRLFSLTRRQVLIVLHDIVATAAAIVATFFVRFDEAQFAQRLPALKFLPLFLIYAAAVYFVFNLHRNKWRFTSLPDLYQYRARRRPCWRCRCWCSTTFCSRPTSTAVLLRQDHHPAVLAVADVLAGRLARRLPLFPLRARHPARARRRRGADAGDRPRRRRRGAAARDRERRGAQASGRSASCRRRSPIAASRSAASRCWARSTISNASSPTSTAAAPASSGWC